MGRERRREEGAEEGLKEGLEGALFVIRTNECYHVCSVLCGCVSSWSLHIRCRCKVTCSPVMSHCTM